MCSVADVFFFLLYLLQNWSFFKLTGALVVSLNNILSRIARTNQNESFRALRAFTFRLVFTYTLVTRPNRY